MISKSYLFRYEKTGLRSLASLNAQACNTTQRRVIHITHLQISAQPL
jgi:hypothetical protein